MTLVSENQSGATDDIEVDYKYTITTTGVKGRNGTTARTF